MEKVERDFKGVWIPKEVWESKDLTVMEKLFLVEIDSLDKEDGCYASNEYFSKFFDVTKGRCSQIIKSLEKKNVITITLNYENKQIVKRVIRVFNKLNTPSKKSTKSVVKKLNRVVNKLNPPIKNIKQGYLENAQENNTVFNNTKSNIINTSLTPFTNVDTPPEEPTSDCENGKTDNFLSGYEEETEPQPLAKQAPSENFWNRIRMQKRVCHFCGDKVSGKVKVFQENGAGLHHFCCYDVLCGKQIIGTCGIIDLDKPP